MNKRAIELQFNWIFILIAGAIILAFFFSVVEKQKALSETKLSVTLASQMDAVFSGAVENKGSTQPLVTPSPGIAFSCSDACNCIYKIGNTPTDLDDKLLFAPALIKGQRSIAWAIEWKYPFRIANFLMLTNPGIKYYIVYDSSNQLSAQLFQKINKALPTEINRETFSSPSSAYDVKPEGYAHTRFVFIGTPEPNLRNLNYDFSTEDVSALWVDEDMGKLVFYEKTSPQELEFNQYPSLVAGESTLYGAIFAADHTMYNCVMMQAFERFSAVASVHAGRTKALKDEMESQGRVECSGIYAAIIPELETVAQKAGLLGSSFPGGETPEESGALGIIIGSQSGLQLQNRNIIQQSCPELY